MTQSTSPRHVGVIMDGNGRWAKARGRPRSAGHRAGAEALRRVIELAAERRVPTLTLYAFSSDNWRRPAAEVAGLMALFERTLAREVGRLVEAGVRLSVIGRRDRLPRRLVDQIVRAERATANGTMVVRLAVDYSARGALLAAAAAVGPEAGEDDLRRALAAALHAPSPIPDVDLLIRTGGEQRLSDFLLWECAYAELYFTSVWWPDFGAEDFDQALTVFAGRDRRFGGLTRAVG